MKKGIVIAAAVSSALALSACADKNQPMNSSASASSHTMSGKMGGSSCKSSDNTGKMGGSSCKSSS